MKIDVIRKEQSDEILAIVINRKKCYVSHDTTFGETRELFKFFKIYFCENLDDKLKTLKAKII
tara:strand:+ start:1509 stop:1697 length:189 start_codon:yes stop_codon:yes gene_type:complete